MSCMINTFMTEQHYDDFEDLEEYEIISLDNKIEPNQRMKIILGDSTLDEEFAIKQQKKTLLYSFPNL